MARIVQKKGFLGDEVIIYFEKEDRNGEYSFINGEWIWVKGES